MAKSLWKHFILPYGCFKKILTNKETAFELFQELCYQYNYKKVQTTAYYPQGNGLFDKVNQMLLLQKSPY